MFSKAWLSRAGDTIHRLGPRAPEHYAIFGGFLLTLRVQWTRETGMKHASSYHLSISALPKPSDNPNAWSTCAANKLQCFWPSIISGWKKIPDI
uniref:Uncharacterized protein n=1 Tax=Moniliophthora roreri TaxID=221103 RepID=A0A0W0EZ23_MONRR